MVVPGWLLARMVSLIPFTVFSGEPPPYRRRWREYASDRPAMESPSIETTTATTQALRIDLVTLSNLWPKTASVAESRSCRVLEAEDVEA